MTCLIELIAFPRLGNRRIWEGVHSADDYIIYGWKRIQNRAINAQMRPATKRLQPERLSAQQSERWALQNGQVQHCFNGSLPPFPPKDKQPLNGHSYHSDGGRKSPGVSSFGWTSKWAGVTTEELQPFGQIHQSSLRPCFHVWTHSCTEAPSQIFCYHQSGRCETTTPCVIWPAHASPGGARG